MSYESISYFSQKTKTALIKEAIELLGYIRCNDPFEIPHCIGSYMWYDEENYKSWAGVELSLYKNPEGGVEIYTRSRSCRSYWDLTHQNKTIKYLRDLFGGHFVTDAGRNRYLRPESKPPSPLASGCYLARWKFHNSLIKARVYLDHRKFDGEIAKDRPSGLVWLDDINPRLLSNNLVLPYVIAVWEDYFRTTFVAALKFSAQRKGVIKNARFNHIQIEQIANGTLSTEQAIASSFSFQRPSVISENFRQLDPKIDISGVLRKPYRRRKVSLHESIEALVESRNIFVHAGQMNIELYDKRLKSALDDMTIAVDRAYDHIAKHYGFPPIYDY
ncbi:MAG: hypothetical protein ABWZ08_14045 [Pseudoxanthomonas sp.]